MFLIFNSLGGMELMLILAMALIFFGAKGLPGIAKTLGKGMRQMKDAQRSIQDEIMNATGDMRNDLEDIKKNFSDNEVTQTISDTFSEKNLKPFHPNEVMRDKSNDADVDETSENQETVVEPKKVKTKKPVSESTKK